jgi:hypothetical protein
MTAARTLARTRPGMIFVYSRLHYATQIFRPAAIQPLHGIRSRTRLYRVVYAMTVFLLPVLENRDINRAALL